MMSDTKFQFSRALPACREAALDYISSGGGVVPTTAPEWAESYARIADEHFGFLARHDRLRAIAEQGAPNHVREIMSQAMHMADGYGDAAFMLGCQVGLMLAGGVPAKRVARQGKAARS